MRPNPDDPSQRYFEAARWYLPTMGAEPEPDPALACTYAMLAVYAKLDALIDAMSSNKDQPRADATTVADDLNGMLRTFGWPPARKVRKGPGYN